MKKKERFERNIESIKKALLVNPHDPLLYIKLGTLYRTRGEYKMAVEEYGQALSLDPGIVSAYQGMSMAYLKLGDYEKARSSLFMMLELQTTNAGLYYNIACTYAMENDVKASVEWLEKAIDRGFSDWNLIKTDRDLDNIRESSAYGTFIETHRRKE